MRHSPPPFIPDSVATAVDYLSPSVLHCKHSSGAGSYGRQGSLSALVE